MHIGTAPTGMCKQLTIVFFTGLHTALAFDGLDNPHISYTGGPGSLRYAYWTGTAWDIQTVDAAGSFTSIAIDSNGYPHISYYSVQNGNDLKYASWTGSSWSIQTIDSNAYTGEFTSLKLDSAGYPHISYWDFGKNFETEDLKVASCNSTGWYIQVVDSLGAVGKFTSLDLDKNDNTHISYYDIANGDLKYAVSNGSNWNIQVVDSNGDVGTDTSLALDSQGNPHISYTDNTNHFLKYASSNGSTWNVITIGSAGYVGEYTSLAIDQTSLKIDRDDNAHIAYCDSWNYRLRYVTNPDPSGFAYQCTQPTASFTIGPNPVGVGQTAFIGMTITPNPPKTTERFANITLSITSPNGATNILGPFMSEPNGLLYTHYVPNQVGKYYLQFNYSGQTFTNNATYFPTQSQVIELNVQQEPVTPKIWTVSNSVPADFTSIQAAVNAASPGDTVFVHAGVYKEPQINVKKPLTLMGENKTSTILDGDPGRVRMYVQNTVDVVVTGFAFQNGFGIYSTASKNVSITDNLITNSSQGIVLINAENNTINKNVLSKNIFSLSLSDSYNNKISDNLIVGGDQTITVDHSNLNQIVGNYVPYIRFSYSNSNVVFHNDIATGAQNWRSIDNIWDNGYPSGGNFWSNYHGKDENNDGVGDSPWAIDSNNSDRYPLMNMFGDFNLSSIPTPTPLPTPSPTPTPNINNTPTPSPKENTQTTNPQQTSSNVPPNLNNEPDDETTHLTAESGTTENQPAQSIHQNPEPDLTASIAIFTAIAVPICLRMLICAKRRQS